MQNNGARTIRAVSTKKALSKASKELGPELNILSRRKVETNGESLVEIIVSTEESILQASSPQHYRRWSIAFSILIALSALAVITGLLFFLWRPPARSDNLALRSVASIAVIDFVNYTGEPKLDFWGPAIADLIATDLSQMSRLNIISGQKLDILREIPYMSEGGRFTSSQLMRVAGDLQADYLIFGSYVKSGSIFRILANLTDSSSNTVIFSTFADCDGETGMISTVDTVAVDIRNGLAAHSGITVDDNNRLVREVVTASPLALKYFEEAKKVRSELNDFNLTDELLVKAIEVDPEFALAYWHRAILKVGTGMLDEGRELCRKALSYSGRITEREKLLIQGFYYSISQLNDTDEAIESLETLLGKYPGDFYGLILLGRLYFTLEEYSTAANYFKRATVLFPDNITPAYYLSEIYFRLGLDERANTACKQYVASNPDDLWSTLLPIVVKWREGDLTLAKEAVAMAERLYSGHNIVNYYLAGLYRLTEDYQRCSTIIETMGSSDSPADNYMGFNQYSMMLQQQGKFTEAIAVNRKYQGKLHASIAAFLDATDYYLTVQLYLILGDTAGAMNVIRDGREFLQADYSNISNSKMFEAELILAEGMVSIKSGDLQKADQCITALEKLSYLSALPAIGRYRTLLIACVESTTGDHREAIATLEQLDPHVSRLPDAPMYLYPLAVNYYLDENLDKARELFANLANNSYMKFYHPYESIMGLYWLGRIHQDMSNPEQAGKYFAAFLSHWKEADDKLPEVKDARLRLRNLMASLPGDKLLQRSPTAHSETFRR